MLKEVLNKLAIFISSHRISLETSAEVSNQKNVAVKSGITTSIQNTYARGNEMAGHLSAYIKSNAHKIQQKNSAATVQQKVTPVEKKVTEKVTATKGSLESSSEVPNNEQISSDKIAVPPANEKLSPNNTNFDTETETNVGKNMNHIIYAHSVTVDEHQTLNSTSSTLKITSHVFIILTIGA